MLSLHEIELHKIGPESFTCLALLQNLPQVVKFSTVPVHHSKLICCFLRLFDHSLDIIAA
jgi:hypothetical protein